MRNKLLEVFQSDPTAWQSGEKLAQALGVSRAAVWKSIEKLRQEGMAIEALPRKGYRLGASASLFTAASVASFLTPDLPFALEGHQCIDSTNARAKELAEGGAADWTVVLADQQTSGRGRRGRAFYSPQQGGIYMSVLLRPDVLPREATLLTVAAAVAVAECCEEEAKTSCRIKWVNDVFVDGRKIAGILTEGALSLEENRFSYAVVGIGVNVLPPDSWPEAISETAGALFTEAVFDPLLRSRLAANILLRFYDYAEALTARAYLSAYRDRLFFLNRQVRLIQGQEERIVVARGVDDDGHLLVDNASGEREVISSGEVSLRIN